MCFDWHPQLSGVGSHQAQTLIGEAMFIAKHPRLPLMGNVDGARSHFLSRRACLGYGPAPIRLYATLVRSVERTTNTVAWYLAMSSASKPPPLKIPYWKYHRTKGKLSPPYNIPLLKTSTGHIINFKLINPPKMTNIF